MSERREGNEESIDLLHSDNANDISVHTNMSVSSFEETEWDASLELIFNPTNPIHLNDDEGGLGLYLSGDESDLFSDIEEEEEDEMKAIWSVMKMLQKVATQ